MTGTSEAARLEPKEAGAPAAQREAKRLTHSAAHGLSWNGATLVVRTVLNVVVASVLAHLLSPREYGIAGAAMIVVAIGSTLSNLGMSEVMIQRKALEIRHIATASFISYSIATLLALAQWIFADRIASVMHVPELGEVSRVLAFLMFTGAFNLVAYALLSRHFQFRRTSVAQLVAWAAANFLVGIPMAYLGFSYWALVAASMTESLLLCASYLVMARKFLVLPRFDRVAYREIRGPSLGFSLTAVLTYIATYVDNFVVARFIGTAQLGIYSRSYYLIAMPANLFGNLNRSVVFPLMARVQDDPVRLRNAILKGFALTAALALPFSAFMVIFSHEFVATFLGAKWISATVPIMLFSAGIYFRVGYKVCGTVFLATGNNVHLISMQVLYAISVAVGALLSAPFGVEAVAAAVVIANGFSFLCYSYFCCQHTGVSLRDFLSVHTRPVIAAAGVCLSSGLIKLILAGWPDLLVMTTGALAVGLCFAVTLYLRPSAILGTDGADLIRGLSGFRSK
ncbi:MAG: lipopolysaccharide biosynthesis protein [Rhizomicrobium sp.]